MSGQSGVIRFDEFEYTKKLQLELIALLNYLSALHFLY